MSIVASGEVVELQTYTYNLDSILSALHHCVLYALNFAFKYQFSHQESHIRTYHRGLF